MMDEVNAIVDAVHKMPPDAPGNSVQYSSGSSSMTNSQGGKRQPTDTNGEVGEGSVTISVDGPKPQTVAEFHDPGGRVVPKTQWEEAQLNLRQLTEHLGFRIFTILLIVIDLIIVIVDISLKEENEALSIVSLVIAIVFILEMIIRLLSKGWAFFKEWQEVLDMVIVVSTCLFSLILVTKAFSENTRVGRLIVSVRIIRLIRLIRAIRLYMEQVRVQRGVRHVVSQNKRRYQKDGFDLDLCYITKNMIAMSFPSQGMWGLYRNPIKEVARFLDTKHPEKYRVYNLCRERDYDEEIFHGRVKRIMIDDHNVPPLSDMLEYTADVRELMAQDSDNVIAIHCKGGKGRTGTLICVWLIDSGQFEGAEESLEYFGGRRTDLSVGNKFQGVETPSQSRFVGYYEHMKTKLNRQLPPEVKLVMRQLIIHGIYGVGNQDGSDLSMKLFRNRVEVFSCDFGSNTHCKAEHNIHEDKVVVDLLDCPALFAEVKVMFYSTTNMLKGYENCPFYFWFHTSFIEDNRLMLPRAELDNPHKKKTWHVFGERFAVEILFGSPQ